MNEPSLAKLLNPITSEPLPPVTIVNSKPLEGPFIAPFVPAPQAVIDAAFRFADLSATDILADLGCGDGRILVSALNYLPLKLCIGIELDPILVAHINQSQQLLIQSGKLMILCKDMFTIDQAVDLKDSTLLILYLLPRGLDLLKPILHIWLSANPIVRRIITITYSIPDWNTKRGQQIGKHWLFLYTFNDL